MRIDGRAQHCVEAVVTRMNQRSAKPAKRSQTGLGPVGKNLDIAGTSRFTSPTNHYLCSNRGEGGNRVIEKAPSLPERSSLVRAEPLAVSSRQSGSENAALLIYHERCS